MKKLKNSPKSLKSNNSSNSKRLFAVTPEVILSKEERKAKKIAEKVNKTINDLFIFSGEKADSAISMAIKLVNRFGCWKRELAKKGIILPDFYFSCDSGYSHELLEKACKDNQLAYISVVQKLHNFEINGKRIKASDLIKNVFLGAEKKHQEAEKHLLENEKTPFYCRMKGKYCSQNNKQVVLLLFGLNHSKKYLLFTQRS